ITNQCARRNLLSMTADPVRPIWRSGHLTGAHASLHLNHFMRSCRQLSINAERQSSLREMRVDKYKAHVVLDEMSLEPCAMPVGSRTRQRLPCACGTIRALRHPESRCAAAEQSLVLILTNR